MKTLILTRTNDDGKQTKGTLRSKDGIWGRFTLERPWKNNQTNISCIPKGEYLVKWTFSYRFLRYTYQVMNVPGRSGIRFHKGNFFFNVEGCILLGSGYSDINHDGEVDIINSTQTMKEFEILMGQEDFHLTIV